MKKIKDELQLHRRKFRNAIESVCTVISHATNYSPHHRLSYFFRIGRQMQICRGEDTLRNQYICFLGLGYASIEGKHTIFFL